MQVVQARPVNRLMQLHLLTQLSFRGAPLFVTGPSRPGFAGILVFAPDGKALGQSARALTSQLQTIPYLSNRAFMLV